MVVGLGPVEGFFFCVRHVGLENAAHLFCWHVGLQLTTKAHPARACRVHPTYFRIHVLAEVMDACVLLQEEDTGQKRDGVHAKHWERLFFSELLQHVCGGIHYSFLCSLLPVPASDASAKKLNVSHHQVAMGKRADAKQEQKKGVRKESKGEKKEVAWVPKFRFFAKESLRSYPDTDGVCVFVRKGEDERKFSN